MFYASYAKKHPDELRIVGVADPCDLRRKTMAIPTGQENWPSKADVIEGETLPADTQLRTGQFSMWKEDKVRKIHNPFRLKYLLIIMRQGLPWQIGLRRITFRLEREL